MRDNLKRNIAYLGTIQFITLVIGLIIQNVNFIPDDIKEIARFSMAAFIIYFAYCIFACSYMLITKKDEITLLTMAKIQSIGVAISLTLTTIFVIIDKVLPSNATDNAKIFIIACMGMVVLVGVVILFISYSRKKKYYLYEDIEDSENIE